MFRIRDFQRAITRMWPRRRFLALACTGGCFLLLLGVVLGNWLWRSREDAPEPPIPEPRKERTLVRYGSPFAFSSDGNELLVTEEGNLTTPGLIARLPPRHDTSQPRFRTIRRPWNRLAWSPDSKRLAYGGNGRLSAKEPTLDRILLLDSSNGEVVHDLVGHDGMIRSLAFSPDSQKLASTSEDHTVRLWDVATGKQLQTWRGGKDHRGMDIEFCSVTFSPDGRQLAGIDMWCAIHLWDTTTGELLQVIKQNDEVDTVSPGLPARVLFHPNGRLLVATDSVRVSKDTLRLLGFRGFLNVWELLSPTKAVKRATTTGCGGDNAWPLGFSRDGHYLIWLGDDDSLYFWSLRKRKIVRTFYVGPHGRHYVFSPDMRRLAVANGVDAPSVVTTIWDMEPADEQPPPDMR